MYEAVYIAATGLTQQQLRLDTVANNLANVNTNGYKATRLDFKDALYTANGLGPIASPAENHQKGHGVIGTANNRIFDNGAFTTTGSMLDFALEGDGFMELEDANGQLLYTRAGNFYLTQANPGGDSYLVNSQGYFVRDGQGGRVMCPAGATGVSCDAAGLMTFEGTEPLQQVQLGLFEFPNQSGLESAGGENFRVSAASGEKMAAGACTVRQGALEASNVSLSEEMTRMIRSQRAFSLASRALTTADDMEGIANNLRR